MSNHPNRSAARQNDLALVVSYSVLGQGRVNVSVVPVRTWDERNPHMVAPQVNEMHQRGPVCNDQITYVGRFETIADCQAQLRSIERRLGIKVGSLAAKLPELHPGLTAQ